MGEFDPGAGEGNRTLVISLEGFCSTIELHPPREPPSAPAWRAPQESFLNPTTQTSPHPPGTGLRRRRFPALSRYSPLLFVSQLSSATIQPLPLATAPWGLVEEVGFEPT